MRNLRNYLRDLIDTTSLYLKMMEKFCSGSIVVQTKVKSKAKRKATKRPTKRPKQLSKEEVLVSIEKLLMNLFMKSETFHGFRRS